MTNGLDCRFLSASQRPVSVEIRLEEFSRLGRGWHYGQGLPFSRTTVENARRLSTVAEREGFRVQETFPGVNGEILINLYPSEYEEIELTITEEGRIELLVERHGEYCEDERGLSLEDAEGWLNKLKCRESWLSGSSTLSTTTVLTRSGSAVPLSRHRAVTTGSPYLTRPAPAGQVGQFVSI